MSVRLGAQFVPRPPFDLAELIVRNRTPDTLYINLECTRFTIEAIKARREARLRARMLGVPTRG